MVDGLFLFSEDIDTYTEARDLWYQGLEKMQEQAAEGGKSKNSEKSEDNINGRTSEAGEEISKEEELSWSGKRNIPKCNKGYGRSGHDYQVKYEGR